MFTFKQIKVKIKGEVNCNWTLFTQHLIGGYLMEVHLYTILTGKKSKLSKRDMALEITIPLKWTNVFGVLLKNVS